jgi:hypothetical protein
LGLRALTSLPRPRHLLVVLAEDNAAGEAAANSARRVEHAGRRAARCRRTGSAHFVARKVRLIGSDAGGKFLFERELTERELTG